MSTALQDILSESWAKHSPLRKGRTVGPVTATYQRRTLIIYVAMIVLGSLPWLLGGNEFLKSAGLGLWFPGAGFIASAGLWSILIVPIILALFALALFVWFGSGMVIAPAVVWLGAAIIAGTFSSATWNGAPPVAGGLLLAFAGYVQWRALKERGAAAAKRAFRNSALETGVERALAIASPAPDFRERELSETDVKAVRYLLDRALQPPGRFDGFDIVDQFQTASLRYQINNCGYALAEIQTNYLPNLRGYLETAQLNLIEKYLQPKVWTYWSWETSWGHLNFTNHDPVGKDNIMLTGWLALHAGMYMLASGDHRFLEKGSLTFRKNARTAYVHDANDLVRSLNSNYTDAPFCIYPCEPNWAYPICNYIGITGLVAMDAVKKTDHASSLRDRWTTALDTEFTDESGSVIGLRSTLTGLRFPFPGGELGFATYQKVLEPGRAWRMWAVARTELEFVMGKTRSGEKRLKLPGRGFDFGNYGPGFGGSYAAIMLAAREFGDDELAFAAWRSLEEDCGLSEDNGVRRFTRMSNLSNISAVMGQVRRQGDYERAVKKGPPDLFRSGPMLTGIAYPDVLVARAVSADGQGLDLVLYPGAQSGPQNLEIMNLAPSGHYRVVGATSEIIKADETGKAKLVANLHGRTEVTIRAE